MEFSIFVEFGFLGGLHKDYITNEWPDSRYTDNGNGTVLDSQTGLVWKKCTEGLSGQNCGTGSAITHTWQDALTLAQNSNFASKSDWRLPNIKELRSLAAYNCYSPSINKSIFPNTPASSFWSSSPYAYNAYDA